jgi:hypothetical protein
MTDYEPVSLLRVFMCNRLNHLTHTNNISVPAKFGFREGIFTEQSIFKLNDNLFKAINQTVHVIMES